MYVFRRHFNKTVSKITKNSRNSISRRPATTLIFSTMYILVTKTYPYAHDHMDQIMKYVTQMMFWF